MRIAANKILRSNGMFDNGIFKILKAITVCITAIIDCVAKLAMAAPCAYNRGIKIKLTIKLITMPTTADQFNNRMLPFAVSNVPKI